KNRPTLHDRKKANNSVSAGNGAVRLHFRLGLDVDLRHIVVAIQCERSLIGPAQKFSRAQLLAWVKKKDCPGVTRSTRCMSAAGLVTRCTKSCLGPEHTALSPRRCD